MKRTAILLGASGLVGGYCLKALSESAAWDSVVVLNRRDLPLPAGSRVMQKVVDLRNLSAADFAGASDVFCATGSTMRKAGSQEEFRRIDYEMPLNAARAALEAGARQFVLVSSVGAKAGSKSFYLRTKGELERDLSKLGFEGLHIMRPGLLLGHRQEFRPGEHIATRFAPVLALTLWGALRRYRPIPAETVGRAMAGVAREGRSGTHVYEYREIMRLARDYTHRWLPSTG